MSAAEQLTLSPVDLSSPATRRRRPHAAVLVLASLKSTGVPMLVEEIARAAHLPLSSVAARVGEMMRAGLVLPSQYRGTSHGRGAWAFVLPDALDPVRLEACRYLARRLAASRGRYRPESAEILGT